MCGPGLKSNLKRPKTFSSSPQPRHKKQQLHEREIIEKEKEETCGEYKKSEVEEESKTVHRQTKKK